MNQLIERMDSMADTHVTDKAFAEIVQQSGHRPAINRLEVAVYVHELAIARGEKRPDTATFPETATKAGLDLSKPYEEATKAAREFISLTEKYAKHNLPWKEQEKIREGMDAIAEENLKHKVFSDTIEKSGSKAAMDRLNLELYTRVTIQIVYKC